jgi:uncharacterized 2Fe-2S/4Fe-4S cluster protein (DUF4445 family)
LRRICISGFFGRFLDSANAQDIGLLPRLPIEKVELCGSTALAGCAEALMLPEQLERMQDLRNLAILIDMSRCPDFDELFLENLYLQPMGGF